MKEWKQECGLRLRKGRRSVERKTRECHEWKAKSFEKETLAVSAATTVGVERKHNRPLLLRNRRHKMTEGRLLKGKTQKREQSFRKEKSNTVQTLPERNLYESVV